MTCEQNKKQNTDLNGDHSVQDDMGEINELNYKEKLSLSSDKICLIDKITAKRKTKEDQERNCKYYDIDTCVELVEQEKTYYECLLNNCYTKLYLDIENDTFEDEPYDDDKEAMLNEIKEDIAAMFSADEGFDVNRDVAIAQRHRWIEKNGKKTFKMSFRFWVLRYVLPYNRIPDLIREFGRENYKIPKIQASYDLSCYNPNNQVINSIWSSKETDLGHPLTPITDHDTKDFICQYFNGTEKVLNMPERKVEVKKEKKEVVDVERKEVIALLKMMDKNRVDTYHDWVKVGWALKSCGDYKDEWVEWSKQSFKFNERQCENIWDNAKCDGLTIASLHYWAKKDNPNAYKSLLQNGLFKLITTSASGTHYDIALVVERKYRGNFVCANIAKQIWYYYDCHRWVVDDDGTHLFSKLSNEVVAEYRKVIRKYNEKANGSDVEPEDKDRYDKICEALQKVIKNLKNNTFKKSVMKELSNMMKVDKFIDKLDEKPNLLGFNNGVYDLDKFVFREGDPSDMLTFSTGYDFNPNSNPEARKKIMDFFTSIQDGEERRDYLLNVIAMSIHGDKKNELVFFFIGAGRNGKGVSNVLIMKTLGDYFYAPAIQYYTTKRQSSSGANPEAYKMKGKRMLVSTEPEADETIYVNKLKEMTGGDPIQARALYQTEFVEFICQALPALQMNNKPKLSSTDGGIESRLRLIKFPYVFVEKPTFDFHKEMDKNIKADFKNDSIYHQEFMLMLIERYKAYVEKGYVLHTPQQVLDDSKEYLNENNHLYNFIVENYEFDEGGVVLWKEFLTDFKTYIKNDKSKAMGKSDMKDQLVKLGCFVKQSKMKLYRDKECVFGLKAKQWVCENGDDLGD